MRYIIKVTKETLKMLKRIEKESKYPQVRKRALCIQLSYEGWKIKELIKILKVSRNTIYNWFNDWEDYQLIGLYNRKGRGRKSKLNSQEKEIVKEWVKSSPKNLEKVKVKIKKEWEIEISKETIKRIIKEKKMGWYRVRRRVKGYPDEEEYQEKKRQIKELQYREERGEIDLYYADEAGFCLTPCVPYAWQESQEKIEIKSSRSKRLNVLGFLSKSNDLESYMFNCSINSEVVVACIDKFSEKIKKETFIIMDNASIHQNENLWDKQVEWSKKGLNIFFLPKYSPQLNKIEILWRFMKYQWLETEAYESYSNLVKSVENILVNFGSEYTINFA